MNSLKTTFLMALLTVLLILIGGGIAGENGMIIAFMIAIVMNFVSYFFSDKIVLKMYGANEMPRNEYPHIYEMVQSMTQNSNLPMPRLYITPSEQPNAFATGRDPQHAAVVFTRGIINLLSTAELKGVAAHELAHVKNRDILIGSIAATLAGAISMLANMASWSFMFAGRRDDDDGDRSGGIFMLIVAPIAAMLIQLAISRSREFLADETGAKMCHDPLSLANALKKLETNSRSIPMESATPATAHLFIVNPFSLSGITKLFSTHPPMEERIKRLEQIAYGRD